MRGLVALAVAIGSASSPALERQAMAHLGIQATEWVLQTPQGKQLRSSDLIGAKLRLQGGALLSLDAAKLVADTTGRSWWAHELSVRTGAGVWQPLSEPHVDGTRYAVVLPGREEPDGSLSFDPQSFAISCTTGALASACASATSPGS